MIFQFNFINFFFNKFKFFKKAPSQGWQQIGFPKVAHPVTTVEHPSPLLDLLLLE